MMKTKFKTTYLLVAFLLLQISFLSASDYYVSNFGRDSDAGTLAAPFATIQHAVNIVSPGDTVYVRGGTYRDKIDLSGIAGASGNPITLMNYQDEEVSLDGTLPILSAWSSHAGNIYKTTLTEDITQLYVDGDMMTLARFPNALVWSDTMWSWKGARLRGYGVTGTMTEHPVNTDLADSGISFAGCVAVMNFGAYVTSARVITTHTAGSNQFTYDNNLQLPDDGGYYFLEGGVDAAELVMLDMAEEWAYDESTKTLYLWADDGQDPTGREVTGKTTEIYNMIGDYATQYIVIDGLDFLGTTFSFEGSDDITLRNCDLKYYAGTQRAIGSKKAAETAQFVSDDDDWCNNITIFNCSFKYADATGVWATGSENFLFENNLVEHINYSNNYSDPWDVPDEGPEKSFTLYFGETRDFVYRRNTLRYSGGSQGMHNRKYTDGDDTGSVTYQPSSGLETYPSIWEYNYHTKLLLQTTDASTFYAHEEHMIESLTRYNWCLNNGGRDFRYDGANPDPAGAYGVYGNIYRNVSMTDASKTQDSGADGYTLKGDYHEIYNNIGINNGNVSDQGSILSVNENLGGNANSLAYNNAADFLEGVSAAPNVSNNFNGDGDAKTMLDLLRDPVNWDFRPRADAIELIDQGLPVTITVDRVDIDVTAGFNGAAPDLGAYELNDPVYFIGGRQEAKASMGVPLNDTITAKTDADLMFLIGLYGTSAEIFYGTNPITVFNATTPNKTKVQPNNIYNPTLAAATKYYWRVDTITPSGTVKGDVWNFATTGYAPDSVSPGQVTGLAATGGEGISLDWNNHPASDLAYYSVYRGLTTSTSLIATGIITSDFVDASCEAGTTYFYSVKAHDTSGNSSTKCNAVSADAVNTVAPAAPMNLKVMYDNGIPATTVLQWEANAEADMVNGGTYNVYRSTTAGSYGAPHVTGVMSSVFMSSVFIATYTQSYYYVITAVDNSGNESAYSNEHFVSYGPLAAPANLIANDGGAFVSLSWDANTEPGLASYSVYRSLSDGGPYSLIQADIAVNAYTDTAVTQATTYYYVVTTVNTDILESSYSNQASASPNAVDVAYWRFENNLLDSGINGFELIMVSDSAELKALPGSGPGSAIPNSVPLTSLANSYVGHSGGMASYFEYTNAGTWFDFGTDPVTVEAFITSGVDGSQAQTIFEPGSSVFQISNTTGEMKFNMKEGTSWKSVTWSPTGGFIQGNDYYVAAVVEPGALGAGADTRVKFYYQDLTAGTPIEDSGDLTIVGRTTFKVAGATIWVGGRGSSARKAVEYIDEFRISKEVLAQAELLITNTGAPAAPRNLTAVNGASLVNLSWDASTEWDLASYSVYRSQSDGGPYSLIQADIAVNTYSDAAVTDATTYYYVVRAVDVETNESLDSNQASVTYAAPDLYPAWKALAFTDSDAPLTGRTDDYDGDGVLNQEEYIFGMNPESSNNSRAPAAVMVTSGSDYPAITYTYRTDAAITYEIETSIDLSNWEPKVDHTALTAAFAFEAGDGLETDENGDGTTTVTLRSTTAYSPTDPKLFFRIIATEQ